MPKTVTNDQKLQLCFLAKTFLISFIVDLSSLDTRRNSGCWQEHSNSRFKVGIKKRMCSKWSFVEGLYKPQIIFSSRCINSGNLRTLIKGQNHFSLGKYQHANNWQEGNCYKTSNIWHQWPKILFKNIVTDCFFKKFIFYLKQVLQNCYSTPKIRVTTTLFYFKTKRLWDLLLV